MQGSIGVYKNTEQHCVQVQSVLLLALVLLKLPDQRKQQNQRLNLQNRLNLLTYHLLMTLQPLLGLKLEGMRSGIAMGS